MPHDNGTNQDGYDPDNGDYPPQTGDSYNPPSNDDTSPEEVNPSETDSGYEGPVGEYDESDIGEIRPRPEPTAPADENEDDGIPDHRGPVPPSAVPYIGPGAQ